MSDKPPVPSGRRAAGSKSAPSPDDGPAAGRLVIECPHCRTSIVLEEPAVRAVEIADDPVVLRLRGPMPGPEVPLDRIVHHLETELVLRALEATGGVKLHAAELLGMKYSTFWERMRRLGLTLDDAADVGDGVALEQVTRVDLELGSGRRETLCLEIPIPGDAGLLPAAVDGLRTRLARHALDQCDGNLSCAAERLGMKYTTFHSLVQRLGVRE